MFFLVGDVIRTSPLLVKDTTLLTAVAGRRAHEEVVNLLVELAIVLHQGLAVFLGSLLGLESLPLGAHVVNLHLPVELGVVVLASTEPALPERQMVRVDSDTVVLGVTALTEVAPATLLLLEIETGGVGEEDQGQEHTSETEPRDDVEPGLGADVVVQDGGDESTELTHGGGETVGGGTDRGGEDLTGDQEGDGVGTELVEEGRQEVHGLEAVDTGGRGVVLVLEGGDDEHEEAHEETDLLHVLTTVHLVVDEERGEVVTGQLHGDVDQIPGPVGHQTGGGTTNDGDELALEELVTVEENVVGEPGTGSSNETATEVAENGLKSVEIVSGDVGLSLGGSKRAGGVGELVGTVVDKPQGTDSRDGE